MDGTPHIIKGTGKKQFIMNVFSFTLAFAPFATVLVERWAATGVTRLRLIGAIAG
jgi:hypothetical protein